MADSLVLGFLAVVGSKTNSLFVYPIKCVYLAYFVFENDLGKENY